MNNTGKLVFTVVLIAALGACKKPEAPVSKVADALPDVVKVNSAALYPEGVEWDEANKRYLVTSIHQGEVGSVKDDGSYSVFARDPRMVSTVGIELDTARDRVLVCIADPGASVKTTKETAGKLAALAAYQLSSGKLIKYVELTQDRENSHFCNDIAIDKAGTAYITDSFSTVIYKVDADYNVSVLIDDKAFSGKSFNLNGIVVKDNYLLAVKMNSGQLFKIPLDDPKSFSEVKLGENIEGADGLLWAPDGSLLVIANNNAHIGVPATASVNAVIRFTTDDNWKTATARGKAATGDVFATTGTIRDGQIYVVHAMLHVLFNPETKEHLNQFDIVKYKP